jgi:outer membrane protein assembly factor BamB
MIAAGTDSQAESQGWTRFRGPNGSGVNETSGLPTELGPDINVIWKVPLATGYSSPVLSERFIFLTACEDEKLLTLCLKRGSGGILWRKEAPRPRKEKIDFRNNPASPSPAVTEDRVFVFFPDFGMLAYDDKGRELWRLPLGPFDNFYGMGASPIVADDMVILVCDQNTGSFIVAVEQSSGEVVWKKDRPEAKTGHSTPIVYSEGEGETQILVPGSFMLISYSAKTGERLWWAGGLSFEMKSTPVIDGGFVFINGYGSAFNDPGKQKQVPDFKAALDRYDADRDGRLTLDELPDEDVYSGWFEFVDLARDGTLDEGDWAYFKAALASLNGMLAIRLGGHGDVTESHTAWRYRRRVPQLPSPLVYKNVLTMIDDVGWLTTFRPSTGEVIAQARLRGGGSKFFASPVAADGKIYIVSLRGKVSVLKPGGGLEVLAQSDLREDCYATPAIADGRIYLRTVNTLYCFGQSQSSKVKTR